MNKYKKTNKGITLIALVITIIILLILAGISISSLTGSGLFQKAQEATKVSELKEIEEFARISYMERQLDEITDGKNATMAGVISDLKEKGYNIKQITEGAGNITGITLAEDDITMEKSQQKEITYTFVYEEGTTVRYFVEVQGKYYEILFNNGNITVNTEETNVGEISKEPEVTVMSSDNSVIEVNKTEEGKITLISKEIVGNVEITIKEKKSNAAKTFIATVKVLPEKLTISSTEETIERMSKIKLNATVEPSDVTDKIIWSAEDNDIVNIEEDGIVIGKNAGTTKIFASCGNLLAECKVFVTENDVTFRNSVSEWYDTFRFIHEHRVEKRWGILPFNNNESESHRICSRLESWKI